MLRGPCRSICSEVLITQHFVLSKRQVPKICILARHGRAAGDGLPPDQVIRSVGLACWWAAHVVNVGGPGTRGWVPVALFNRWGAETAGERIPRRRSRQIGNPPDDGGVDRTHVRASRLRPDLGSSLWSGSGTPGRRVLGGPGGTASITRSELSVRNQIQN